MRKYISIILALILCVTPLCACGEANTSSEGLSVVTTIFPEYDWVMSILGSTAEEASVRMLLDSGVDLHSYQPTADDIISIGSCDVFIYVGGESDEWAEDAIKSASNKDMKVIKLLDVLGDMAKAEETVEGMEAEEEEDGEALDEHIWLSLKNASVCCEEIARVLSEADAENASVYTANAEAYIEKLNALDAKYADAVSSARLDTLLFADRFPFRYLADDYGLSYFAAFSGCSAESEASFETLAFLADKVNELGLSSVLTLEGSDLKMADTVIKTSGADARILCMDSMQSITAQDVKSGANYLAIMEKNLDVLKEALN